MTSDWQQTVPGTNIIAQPQHGSCPSCGRCRCCGSGVQPVYIPAPTPYYPTFPQIVWGTYTTGSYS